MDATYLEDFQESSDSDDEVDEYEPPSKKMRGKARLWVKDAHYNSKEEAEELVDTSMWKKCSSQNTMEGVRVEYRCTGGLYRKAECPAGIYLLYHASSSEVSRFRVDVEHDNHNNPQRGLTAEIKTIIREKFEEGTRKPNAILQTFRKKHMPEPPRSKVVNYLRTLRYD